MLPSYFFSCLLFMVFFVLKIHDDVLIFSVMSVNAGCEVQDEFVGRLVLIPLGNKNVHRALCTASDPVFCSAPTSAAAGAHKNLKKEQKKNELFCLVK